MTVASSHWWHVQCPSLFRMCLGVCGLVFLGALQAAPYKVVGPDGRVTYTDRPPAHQPAQSLGSRAGPPSGAALPYALQQVVARFPVTLYTGQRCAPCDAGRALLKSRGIPYTEKTVTTADDVQAYRAREGTQQLPSLRIGDKQLLGLVQSEWHSYLDAAGYPSSSTLPGNHVQPEPTAYAPKSGPKAESSASSPAEPGAPISPAPASPAGNAPPGFRF